MTGEKYIIEVDHERPAWIANNPPPGERDSLTFEINKAHVFPEHRLARDTVSRLKCGYPQWQCKRFT